jgi:precorrin-2 dehydrogenase/sirohydrochlorin ferrochelatase
MAEENSAESHPNYPVNLTIRGRSCLVVGGGKIALRKASGLLASGAVLTVVAPEVCEALRSLPVSVIEREYTQSDLSQMWLVITCTDSAEVNAQVSADAAAEMIWVNSADDLPNCSFILPAVAWRQDLSIAVSTAGKSPAMASWLRRRFETEFDDGYIQLLDLLTSVRIEAKRELGTSEVPGWLEALEGGLLELVAEGDSATARRNLRASLGLAAA